jgi:hypothetical protein
MAESFFAMLEMRIDMTRRPSADTRRGVQACGGAIIWFDWASWSVPGMKLAGDDAFSDANEAIACAS